MRHLETTKPILQQKIRSGNLSPKRLYATVEKEYPALETIVDHYEKNSGLPQRHDAPSQRRNKTHEGWGESNNLNFEELYMLAENISQPTRNTVRNREQPRPKKRS